MNKWSYFHAVEYTEQYANTIDLVWGRPEVGQGLGEEGQKGKKKWAISVVLSTVKKQKQKKTNGY